MKHFTAKKMIFAIALTICLAGLPHPASAMEALDLLNCRGGLGDKISLNFVDAPLSIVIDEMQRMRPGVNLKVQAQTPAEEEALLASPVTISISGVDWDTGLNYLAERSRLAVDRRQETSGLVYLEKPARFSDTFNGVPLGAAVREIARRGNANVVFSADIDTNQPVYLSFTDVPWRDALASILAANSCAMLEDADGRILRISSAKEAKTQLETRLRPLRYARPDMAVIRPDGFWTDALAADPAGEEAEKQAKSIIAILEGMKSPQGSVGYEKRNNTLVLTDSRDILQTMLKTIDALDVPPAQVLIETRIITLDACSDSYPEIRWDYDSAWTGEEGDGWDNDLGKTGTMSRDALESLLIAARMDPGINIVQAPEMLVLDGEEAAVFVGDLHNASQANGSFDRTMVGTYLAMLPNVCRGTGEVLLEMLPSQAGEVVVDNAGQGGYKPAMAVRQNVKAVRTKMLLQSSETGVISGLLEDVDKKGQGKPAGSRFSFWRKNKGEPAPDMRRNTLILVTPTIIPSSCGNGEDDSEVDMVRQSLAAKSWQQSGAGFGK